MRRLPSLNALRAFEAAARTGGFTAAARELNVTQAAVSRQVGLLEDRLGFPLFERHANALALTERGRALLPGLTGAFDAIAESVERVTCMRGGPVLTMGVGATFAVRWLIPRLSGFHTRHPDIEVRITTGGAGNPIREDWTCALLLGDGHWARHEAEPLFTAGMLPVCAPALARTLREPSDLLGATRLSVAHWPNDWPQWFAAMGLEPPAGKGLSFGSYAMALQAAMDGVGVALGAQPYIADDVAAGRLVTPFPQPVPMGRAWYLVARPARRSDPGFAAFRAWLLDTARAEAP
ncbi:transcriptional regulator GcvA [Azospirillum canadense]|uniref:transcriptional regulator GcvA n=1 Tax=Azospirillum canadense TaxID=403962 RepID=UPI002226D7CC|nr:transcriptional regulator GcvA [Azospirillum canadense]MCW2242691.1 LysR family glycine cleavage system transcriptional activator/LysR family transcriptional regulator of beta-lactamase [Azospirillum canadense]